MFVFETINKSKTSSHGSDELKNQVLHYPNYCIAAGQTS